MAAAAPTASDDLVTTAELAEVLGLTPNTVSSYLSTKPHLLPTPVSSAGRRGPTLFRRADALALAEARPRRRPRDDDAPLGGTFDEENAPPTTRRAADYAGTPLTRRPPWPPTREELVSYLGSNSSAGLPGPDPEDFPDDGTPVPSYASLSGRVVRPRWKPCILCGERFLSPDSANVHTCGCPPVIRD